MANFIVGGIVILIIGLALTYMIKDRKKAGHCSGCCAGCSGCTTEDQNEKSVINQDIKN